MHKKFDKENNEIFFEEMEPRLLFSADIDPLLSSESLLQNQAEENEVQPIVQLIKEEDLVKQDPPDK